MIGRPLPPADAIFHLLEQTAGLMKTRAALFERTVRAIREPAELAKAAADLRRGDPSRPGRQAPVASLTKRLRSPPSHAAAGHRQAATHRGAIEAAGRRLLAVGADRLPALRVGRALFWGEDRIAEAAVAARMHAAAAGH